MEAITFDTDITKTWLIFDPMQPITLCAYKSPREIGSGITLSFSGYVKDYSQAPLNTNGYIEPYFLTIYHHIGNERKIPRASRIINTSGYSVGSGLVAQPSFQESLSALREVSKYASCDNGTDAIFTIFLLEEGIGISRYKFYNPFTLIKFEKNLVHEQIELHPFAFEGFRADMQTTNGQEKKCIHFDTGLSNVTEELISSKQEIVLYENQNEYGWIIDSESEYKDIIKHSKDHFMVNNLGIANTSTPRYISIPRGYRICHVWQSQAIILFDAIHKSIERTQDKIFSWEEPIVKNQEVFSYVLGKYRIPYSWEFNLTKKKESIEQAIKKEGKYEYCRDLFDIFIEEYLEQSEYFEDYYPICPPLKSYLIGAIEQAEENAAHGLYLWQAWLKYFEHPFPGEYLLQQNFEYSGAEENTSYLRIVYRSLYLPSSGISDERGKLLYKAYENFLQSKTSQKIAKKISVLEMNLDYTFDSFIAEYSLACDKHTKESLEDQINYINKLLMSPE